jgi:hypothetical protein
MHALNVHRFHIDFVHTVWILSYSLTHFLQGYSSRLAALDYTVSVQSQVFVTTQGENFPHFLMGHRRYLLGENAKTIKPYKRKLVLSFDHPNIRLV